METSKNGVVGVRGRVSHTFTKSLIRHWLPFSAVMMSLVDKKFTSHPKADSGRVLKVTHDGDVTWFTPIITTTKCVQEAYYFPLERQICNLTFGSWLYDATQVKISASFDDDAMEFVFKSDKVWDLTEFDAVAYEKKYACCENAWSLVNYKVTLQRRPFFYLLIICFPCVLLSLLVLAVFWAPHEAGEKISMAIQNLLALLLFHQLAAQLRPPSSSVQLFGN
ncbi:putative neuronal acetylcholine receptor subunit alpha-9 [Apostichopus japonicus]|uniref:Putative neuronal acetylcholine receptor subunit alpha-9 n=1 Tax=Stichopus japonicus TaxID=307972 RepID=A0A2G8JSN5_STIJA|nr:putative neuronal acetylcholine receptor subunit alpha-9 [Apostichopus japonicus]